MEIQTNHSKNYRSQKLSQSDIAETFKGQGRWRGGGEGEREVLTGGRSRVEGR